MEGFLSDGWGLTVQGRVCFHRVPDAGKPARLSSRARQAGGVVHAHAALRSCSGLQWTGRGPAHRRGQSVLLY